MLTLADYKYDLVYSNNPIKTADDIAMEWFEEVKNKKEILAITDTMPVAIVIRLYLRVSVFK